MPWEEKLVQQSVYLKESIAGQLQIVVVDSKKPLFLHLVKRRVEPMLQVDSELLAEVAALYIAEFHLEHELADHSLFCVRSESSPERKDALLGLVDVGFPVVLVLIMRAIDVREGS